MTVHSRWTTGGLEFFKSGSTSSIATITETGLGLMATNFYFGTTDYAFGSTAGISFSTTAAVNTITVVRGIVTACTT